MTTVSREDQRTAEELFQLLDKDKNGVLTERELKKGLRCAVSINPTDKEMDNIFKEMGVVKGQSITKEQFTKTIIRYIQDNNNTVKSKEDLENEYRQAFRVFDRDGNGTVNRRELSRALKNLGEKMSDADVKQMFDAADTNKDGKIEYKEFVRMFTRDIEKK